MTRLRWFLLGTAVAAAIALAGCRATGQGAATAAGSPTARTPRAPGRCPAGGPDLGRLAFVRNGSLKLLDLASCHLRTLVGHGVRPPVHWSADGTDIAFGDGAVIRVADRRVSHPLGQVSDWAGSPDGHELAAVTKRGGVVVRLDPSRPRLTIVPGGFGARGVLFTPDGNDVVVSRSVGSYGPNGFKGHEQAWEVDLAHRTRKLLWSRRAMAANGPYLAGFTPDRRDLLLWTSTTPSIDSDGQPLLAVPLDGTKATGVTTSLVYPDYVADDCGSRLVVAAGGYRYASWRKHLAIAAPPTWTARPLTAAKRRSWTSPSCPVSGSVVATAAGPNRQGRFGGERRSIFVVPTAGGKPRRLTFAATKTISDDAPRFSRDGRTILFVRMHTGRGDRYRGDLYALRAAHANWHGRVRTYGPIASLGTTGSGYYGHYGWDDATDWHQPR